MDVHTWGDSKLNEGQDGLHETVWRIYLYLECRRPDELTDIDPTVYVETLKG